MTPVRDAYLRAAASAAELLRDPAVASSWEAPSALRELRVSGLAGHLARQVVGVPAVLAVAAPDEPPLSLLSHYARAEWVAAGINDEANVSIRHQGEDEAADGAAALAGRTADAAAKLRAQLPAEPADRLVHLPWAPWSLTLDDFLVTRMMEIAVHSDDLAESVGIPTPPLPEDVLRPVLALLTQLSARRHGPTALLRALSRDERAPATIAAF
jgi:Mycothiol maleylpyruvate isomerase N-terminal domain